MWLGFIAVVAAAESAAAAAAAAVAAAIAASPVAALQRAESVPASRLPVRHSPRG